MKRECKFPECVERLARVEEKIDFIREDLQEVKGLKVSINKNTWHRRVSSIIVGSIGTIFGIIIVAYPEQTLAVIKHIIGG